MKIAVVALGKMGLPVAAYYAGQGHHVTGCDTDPVTVARINRGDSPITHEPGLVEAVRDLVAIERLRATADTVEGVRGAEVIIVLAPLLIDAAHQPDYSPLDSAFAAVARGVEDGALVLLETTVAVGDTRGRFLPILEAGGKRHGRDFHLVFSPERMQSGTVVRDLTTYPHVVGGLSEAAGERAAAFYAGNLHVPVERLSTPEAAEFCKLAESIYRDVNIALANELARYAEECGVDVGEVFPVANSQPQSHLHAPGVGVGGHCIPVYPYLVTGRTETTRVTALAREVNDAMPAHAATLLDRALGGLAGQRVLILGVAFRPGIKEAAHSPALDIARELEACGAEVLAHDPLFDSAELRALGLQHADLDPAPTVDAIVLQTAHPAYRTLDWTRFSGLRVVLDGRAALDPAAVSAAGVRYIAVGRGTVEGGR